MTDLIGLGTLALYRNPDELAKLRADPGLMKSAVEELLRYDSPVHVLGRAAVVDTTFSDGQELKAGEHVIVLIGAANHDPAQYDEPEKLKVDRFAGENPAEVPLSFAWGPHHCIGAQLARAEGQLVFSRMLERFGSIEVDESNLAWRRSSTFRGLERLDVTLTPK